MEAAVPAPNIFRFENFHSLQPVIFSCPENFFRPVLNTTPFFCMYRIFLPGILFVSCELKIKLFRLAEPNSFFGKDMVTWLVDNGWSNSVESALFLCSDILFSNKIIVPGVYLSLFTFSFWANLASCPTWCLSSRVLCTKIEDFLIRVVR